MKETPTGQGDPTGRMGSTFSGSPYPYTDHASVRKPASGESDKTLLDKVKICASN